MPEIGGVGAVQSGSFSGVTPKGGTRTLSEEQQREVDRLAARDREVRQHEQAHLAASAGYGRGPSYTYTRGPDGKQYATGGEVQIDTSAARTPEQTIIKAQVIRRAALAPGDPSPQDRAVAAAAARLESDARRKIAEKSQTDPAEDKAVSASNAVLTAYAQSDSASNRTAPFNQLA